MRIAVTALLFFGCVTAAADESVGQTAKPNIVFVLVDDFGARDLACYGSTIYETPNMDRLAQEGAKFSQAYVAYPRCVPSRFAILTGKHPAPFQKNRDSVHVEPGRDVSFAEPFQAAGYQTFYCGKWHLGDHLAEAGFTTTVAAGAAGATRSQFAPYNVARKGKGENAAIVGLDDAADGEYLTDRLTEETLAFIKANKSGPFLAVLAHYAVHTPIEAKQHLTKRYAEKMAQQAFPEVLFENESAGENLLVQNNATYAAMIASVDNGVGRILKLLDRLELAANTIVVLASDHGGLSARGGKREVATSNRPLRAGKGHLYEGGLRIPMMIRWPGHIQDGITITTPVMSTDLFPTFLELAGLPLQPQNHVDGVSLKTVLTGGEAPADRSFFWHNPAPRPSSTADLFCSAVRSNDLKLLEFPAEQRVELYDLSTDVGEAMNIADQRPQERDRLLKELHAWKQAVGASSTMRLRKKELNR